MTLRLGAADANPDWPISASLPVFALSGGTAQPLATYNVVDNGSSLALSRGFSAPRFQRSGGAAGRGAVVTLSMRDGVSSRMTVNLDANGTLMIGMKKRSILDQDIRTAVLLGLAAAKQRLHADLYDIRSVVIRH